MDITSLVPTIHKLFAAGLAPSTKRAYYSGGVHYCKFCADAKVTPFPTSEKLLLLFVGFLDQQQLSHGTIKSYLAAVRYEKIAQCMGSPNNGAIPQLEYVLKGVKKATPASSRDRLPITPDILVRLRQPHNAKMLWAASCLFFFFSASCAPEKLCPRQRKILTHLPTYVSATFELTATLPHPTYKLQ